MSCGCAGAPIDAFVLGLFAPPWFGNIYFGLARRAPD
jgi:hypothetical protein